LGSPLVFRHDGTVCGLQKKRFGFAESFGPGLAMVPMLGGFLACGGERNIDGKVNMDFKGCLCSLNLWKKVHISINKTFTCFSVLLLVYKWR